MADFSDFKQKFRPREKVVQVAMAGDLLAEHEVLSEELDEVLATARTSLADGGRAAELAARITDLEVQIDASRVPVRFRGMGRNLYKELERKHPDPDNDGVWNTETFPPALIAACAVDPKMTPEQVNELLTLVTEGEYQRLFQGAYMACNDANDVPFNGRASSVTKG